MDQFLNRICSIAGDRREDFLSDGKDLSARLARKAEIENTSFMSTARVALDNYRRVHLLQIIECIPHRSYQAHADVGFQNEWQADCVLPAEPMKRKQPIGCRRSIEQVRIGA